MADYSTSEHWNIAKEFVIENVQEPIARFNQHIIIAEFGTSNLVDELITSEQVRVQARIKSLKRAISDLIQLIDGTAFGMRGKQKEGKGYLDYRKVLIELKQMVDLTFVTITSQKSKTTKIKLNEQVFSMILEEVQGIKRVLLKYLDMENFIFPESPYQNTEDWLKQLEYEMTQTG